MSSLLQDTATGDLVLTNGRATLISGATAGAQKIRNQFRIFLGEWFLDQRVGMPYFQDVLIKNPNLPLVTQLFRGVILNTPGVQSVDSITVSLDGASRAMSVAFAATWDDGSTITADDLDEPFIVQIPSETSVSS